MTDRLEEIRQRWKWYTDGKGVDASEAPTVTFTLAVEDVDELLTTIDELRAQLKKHADEWQLSEDAVVKLEKENKRLREALKPLIIEAKDWVQRYGGEDVVPQYVSLGLQWYEVIQIATLSPKTKAELEAAKVEAQNESVLLTVAEIADLCKFADAHNSDGDTPIVVCRAPVERGCQHVAYFYEYPDEGSQCLGPMSAAEAAGEGTC